MTKKTFIILRILVALVTAFTLRWLFLSGPTIAVGDSDIPCRAVGWDYLGEHYSELGFFDIYDTEAMDEFRRNNDIDEHRLEERKARDKVTEGCNLARDNRRLYMNLTAILGATVFITLPKPKQKKNTSPSDDESKDDQPGSAHPNASTTTTSSASATTTPVASTVTTSDTQ